MIIIYMDISYNWHITIFPINYNIYDNILKFKKLQAF